MGIVHALPCSEKKCHVGVQHCGTTLVAVFLWWKIAQVVEQAFNVAAAVIGPGHVRTPPAEVRETGKCYYRDFRVVGTEPYRCRNPKAHNVGL
jgi:hypothetical protein